MLYIHVYLKKDMNEYEEKKQICLEKREYNEYRTMKSSEFIFSLSALKKTIKCFKKKKERKKIFLCWTAFKIPLH